jgi:hypothetical protein
VEPVKAQLPNVRKVLADMGPLQTLTFRQVDMMGADVYHATFAHGAMDWVIYVTSEGRIAAVFYPRAPPLNPRPALDPAKAS